MGLYTAKPPRTKNHFVVGIGARVYVNWSPPAGQSAHPVPMIDAAGQLMANDLSDGQEVEVVSWRPRSREGLSYQVRRVSDGTEWWIASTYLRRLPVRQSPPPGGATTAAAEVDKR